MRVLFSWLKEFLEISLHPETLSQRLTMGGIEVTHLETVEGDWVFELEVTPNRPDLLCHLGVAREAASLLGRRFRFPRWLARQLRSLGPCGPAVPVSLEDAEGCRRYVVVKIEGVTVGPSPEPLARRLTHLGIRPINNIVDATNLCLLELGQPLHAFDLDRLQGPAIHVRRAQAGETLVTIGEVSRWLSAEQLVIADAKQAVALAGIMGGLPTAIGSSTRRVLLESAWFDPRRIRRSSRQAKLSSESSYRFERGVDLSGVPPAAVRAARMICDLAGGKITGFTEAGSTHAAHRRIRLQPLRAQQVLGMRIYPSQQRRILERLGCKVTSSSLGFRVEPPTWRRDLAIAEDLYEELSRMVGYERCPATLPSLERSPLHTQASPAPAGLTQEAQLRQLLTASGGQEILTYSLLSNKEHLKVKLSKEGEMELENPLSEEQAVLRRTLLVGGLETVARNLHRKTAASFSLFEIGKVYERSPRGVLLEKKRLALLAAGTPAAEWGAVPHQDGLLKLKGILELLFDRLQAGSWSTSLNSELPFLVSPALAYHLEGVYLGSLGTVIPEVLAAYEIPEATPVAYAEVDLEGLLSSSLKPHLVQPLPKVAPVVRDLAILVPAEVPHEEILRAISEAGAPLLREATLFDHYQGPQVPPGKKSLAFRLSFLDPTRTLTDEETTAAHSRVVAGLTARFKAQLR